jgi:hypothetical protein
MLQRDCATERVPEGAMSLFSLICRHIGFVLYFWDLPGAAAQSTHFHFRG